jgi:hypothetical protein
LGTLQDELEVLVFLLEFLYRLYWRTL